MKLKRRDILKLGLASTAAVALDLKFFHLAKNAVAASKEDTEKVVRSTCSPNCTGACGFNAHVSNERINTLIQSADYPEEEYNPRGCLRGLSTTNLIYSKDRLKHPLIRTGPRGSGKFKKATWDEALDYAANKINGITKKYGSNAVALTVQVPGTGYVQKGAFVRLAALNKWSIHHGYDQNGDLPMFWPMTFGVQTEELESLEWLNSRYTMVFGSNLYQTRLPDAKQLTGMKEKGKLVVFDPDYCSTAAKADEWVPLKPDTDAAMGLGLAQVIVAKKLYDKEFLQDFTDFPTLVRGDTGKRLLAGDVKSLAAQAAATKIPAERRLYAIHTPQDFAILDPTSLKPTGADLQGEFTVELTGGGKVQVRTVMSELMDLLADYTPDKVAKICQVPAEQIERVATEAATTKPLHVIYGASNYQWYHGDLKGRALSLLPVLTGNLGKSGAGMSTYAGQYRIRFSLKDWWAPKGGKLNWVPYLAFLAGEGINYPKHGIKAMIGGWGNPFDQHNMADILKKRATSGELEFICTFDFQMTTSCQWSDVVFPAASWYENYDLTATILHPYVQLQQPAIDKLFESRTAVWVARELAKRLELGQEKLFYPDLDEDAAAEEITKRLLAKGHPETEGITWEMLKKGPVRLHSDAPGDRQVPFYSQIQHRVPFPPRSYPAPLKATAKFVKSGRIEFYKDEDLFLKLGEQLPVEKKTFVDTEYRLYPPAKEKYPLHFVTKNSLYRVHSTHSNNVWLNELQGNRPKVFLNPEDAAKRGIKDSDMTEIFNHRGQTRASAVLDPGCRQGTVFFEQGWWARYLDNQSYNSLTYPWINPLHEIYFVPGIWSPTSVWNECLVDVRKVQS